VLCGILRCGGGLVRCCSQADGQSENRSPSRRSIIGKFSRLYVLHLCHPFSHCESFPVPLVNSPPNNSPIYVTYQSAISDSSTVVRNQQIMRSLVKNAPFAKYGSCANPGNSMPGGKILGPRHAQTPPEKGITPGAKTSLYKVGNPSVGATEYPGKQSTGDDKISPHSRIIRFLQSIQLVAKIEG
jgi:hypothetical protein